MFGHCWEEIGSLNLLFEGISVKDDIFNSVDLEVEFYLYVFMACSLDVFFRLHLVIDVDINFSCCCFIDLSENGIRVDDKFLSKDFNYIFIGFEDSSV